MAEVLVTIQPSGHLGGAAYLEGRVVPPEESAAATAAQELLNAQFSRSPYAFFRRATERFIAAESAAEEGLQDGYSERFRDDLEEVNLSFDGWLSAFRAFIDRTSHALSARFGPDSDPRRTFIRATNAEFDGCFEYRFTYKLRNFSQHVGPPITTVKASGKELPDGLQAYSVELGLDPETLLGAYNSWGRVASDLASFDKEVSVRSVVEGAVGAATRIFAHTLLAQERHLREAAGRLLLLDSQVYRHGAIAALGSAASQAGEARQTLNYRHVRVDLAHAALRALDDSAHVLGERSASETGPPRG